MFYPSTMPSSSHLLASSERPPSPSSTGSSTHSSLPQQQLCTSWEQGRCLRGTQCKYLHLSAPSSAPSPHSHSPSASLISSNTFPSFPASSSSHSYSLHSSSPSPTSSPLQPMQPYAASDYDEYSLDQKALRRSIAGLTNRMANVGFYGAGPSNNGTQRKECWDWLAGRCQRGSMCKYMHAGMGGLAGGAMSGNGSVGGGVGGGSGMTDNNNNVCHQWARAGQCQYGDVCKFAHISNYALPPHSHSNSPRPAMSQQSNDYADDADYLAHSNMPLASPPNYAYMSTTASAPPILFRDSRLGLDTEVCRFFAKHSRCKYSNACKFVHIHHGQGGVQVSGVTVTIAELQRLCALHGPGGIASMAGMSNGGGGMSGKMGAMGGGVVGGYDKKAVLALEKEVRELRELKELHDREQRSAVGSQHQSPVERYHPLLPSNSFSSSFSSSSSSPVPHSSPAFSFASTATHLTSSNKSTPPLGGGLGGSFSPSLLHLNGARQLSLESNKAVGSPLHAFSSSSASAFSSFQLSSAEAATQSGVTTSSLFYSHSGPSRSSLHSAASSAAELAAAEADDDSLIAGSTYAALSGSGALMHDRGGRGDVDDLGAVSGVVGVSSGVVCDHCGTNGSVWRDSYSNLCDECYTSLLR